MALSVEESKENELLTMNAGHGVITTDELPSPRAPEKIFKEVRAIL